MPENVQQELLNYIERAAKMAKEVFITWYGGEPLLGKEIATFDLLLDILEVNNLKDITTFASSNVS